MTEKVKYIRFCTVLVLFIMSFQAPCLDTYFPEFDQHTACALITDQTSYLTGTTIWFSMVHNLYWLESSANSYYAEWILEDETGYPVASRRIKVDKHFCNGSFTLPEELVSGCYRLIVLLAVPEEGKLFYCQKWIIVENLYQANTMNLNGSIDSIGTHTQLLPAYDRDSEQQVDSVSFKVYPEFAPLRSQVNSGITIKDSLGDPLHGEFILCISNKTGPAIDPASLTVKQASNSPSNDCGMLEINRPSEEDVARISLVKDEQENYFKLSGWLFPEDSLFSGDIIIGIPGKNGYYVRQPIQNKRFLAIQLPDNIQGDTLMIKLEQKGKEMNFHYDAFSCIKYLNQVPVMKNPCSSSNGSVVKPLDDNTLQRIVLAYEKWGINLLDHSIETTSPAVTGPGPFYGSPDISIRPDEYNTTDDMESFIKDFVPQLRFKEQNQATRLSFTPIYKTELVRKQYPQILINSVPVTDAGVVKKIPVSEIDRIDIMFNPAVYEGNYLNGLIAIILKEKAALKQYLPAEIKLLKIDKEQNSVTLQEQVEETLPDLRSTLCWKTGLKPNPLGIIETMVYTSDIGGIYAVSVIGVAETGGLIHHEKTIEIR